MKKNNDYIPAEKHTDISTGDAIRMLRELKDWTQKQLAEKSGINSKNISLLEHDRVDIGKKRAKSLAAAFGVHPAIIMFPEYEADLISKAA